MERRNLLKVIWAVLCERAIIDRDTNNVSLINVIEEIAISVQPPEGAPDEASDGRLVLANMELVVLWVRSDLEVPERGYGRIRVIAPDEREAPTHENEVDLTQYLRLRTRIRLTSLPMRGSGVYRIKIEGRAPPSSEWTEEFDLPLRVVFQSQDSG
jgi:hypothetical protein